MPTKNKTLNTLSGIFSHTAIAAVMGGTFWIAGGDQIPAHIQKAANDHYYAELVASGNLCTSPNTSIAHDYEHAVDYKQVQIDAFHRAQKAVAPYLTSFSDQDFTTGLHFKPASEIVKMLEAQKPDTLSVAEKTGIIKARWVKEDGKIAYLKIDPSKKLYLQMNLQNGKLQSEGGQAAYIRIKPGNIRQQWDKQGGLHNAEGPAHIEVEFAKNEMHLQWALNDIPRIVGDSPTFARVDMSTHIPFFREWATGSGIPHRRMHRTDSIHFIWEDRQTGIHTETLYRYHQMDPTSDEYVHVINKNPTTGVVIGDKWTLNGVAFKPKPGWTPPPMKMDSRVMEGMQAGKPKQP